MKNILFFILTLFSSTLLFGQNKYDEFIEKGKVAKEGKSFLTAINYFEAAKLQAENEADKKTATNWLDSTFEAMEQVRIEIQDLNKGLEDQIKIVEIQSKKNRLIAESSRLALSARLEIEKDSFYNAIRLAQCANELINNPDLDEEIHLPFINRTFGDAIYYQYRKKLFESWSQEGFFDIEFSKNGTYSVGLSIDSIFFTSNNRTALPIIQSLKYPFRSAHFSPDEKYVVITTQDKDFQLWKIEDSTSVIFSGHEGMLNNAIFSPQGDKIVSCSKDGGAILWDLKGNILANLEGHSKSVVEAKFSKDGTKILTRSADVTAKLWNLDGNLLKSFGGHKGWVNSANISYLNNVTLTSSVENIARIWDTSGSSLPIELQHDDLITDAIFSNEGDKILTISQDGSAKLWDLKGNLLKTLDRHDGWVTQAVFSPNDQYIITDSERMDTTSKHNIQIWNLDADSAIVLNLHTKDIISINFPENDNSMFLTASMDGTTKLWNMEGELLMNLVGKQDVSVRKAVFSPDGKFILIASELPYLIYAPTPQHAKEVIQKNPLRPFTEEEKILFNAHNCQ